KFPRITNQNHYPHSETNEENANILKRESGDIGLEYGRLMGLRPRREYCVIFVEEFHHEEFEYEEDDGEEITFEEDEMKW
ncbi:unnamed protein product, partial [Linum tenue]